jgi:hypothetical protein
MPPSQIPLVPLEKSCPGGGLAERLKVLFAEFPSDEDKGVDMPMGRVVAVFNGDPLYFCFYSVF